MLKNARCQLADLCELKRVCLEGFQRHVAGLNLTVQAKRLLTGGASDAEARRALDLASAELKASAPVLTRCADAQGAAHRTYKF